MDVIRRSSDRFIDRFITGRRLHKRCRQTRKRRTNLRLLELPAELRVLIYRNVFAHRPWLYLRVEWYQAIDLPLQDAKRQCGVTNLLRTCKKVHHEALAELFSLAEIQLSICNRDWPRSDMYHLDNEKWLHKFALRQRVHDRTAMVNPDPWIRMVSRVDRLRMWQYLTKVEVQLTLTHESRRDSRGHDGLFVSFVFMESVREIAKALSSAKYLRELQIRLGWSENHAVPGCLDGVVALLKSVRLARTDVLVDVRVHEDNLDGDERAQLQSEIEGAIVRHAGPVW